MIQIEETFKEISQYWRGMKDQSTLLKENLDYMRDDPKEYSGDGVIGWLTLAKINYIFNKAIVKSYAQSDKIMNQLKLDENNSYVLIRGFKLFRVEAVLLLDERYL